MKSIRICDCNCNSVSVDWILDDYLVTFEINYESILIKKKKTMNPCETYLLWSMMNSITCFWMTWIDAIHWILISLLLIVFNYFSTILLYWWIKQPSSYSEYVHKQWIGPWKNDLGCALYCKQLRNLVVFWLECDARASLYICYWSSVSLLPLHGPSSIIL